MGSAFLSRARLWIALLAVGAVSLACGNAPAPVVVTRTETPAGKAPPRTSLPMPPTNAASAQSFTLLDDRRMRVSDYAGKVVVLDFWATFCPPCRVEAPHLDALQKRFGEQGLVVIGLNVGGPDDRPEIPKFLEELKVSYAQGIPEPEMMNLYMGSDSAIPQTVVLDRKGRILRHFTGYDQTVSAELERAIEEAVTSDK